MKHPVKLILSYPKDGSGHSSYVCLTCNFIINSGQFLSRILDSAFLSTAVMITTEQWRAAIGCFSCSRLCISKSVKKTEFCACNMFVVLVKYI